MENIKTLFFICMSKNCFPSLKQNIEFLIKIKENSKHKMKIFVIDSDSNDGTKEYCDELKKQGSIDSFLEIDNLEKIHRSRIERLAICRNSALEEIKKYTTDSLIYIPIDSDIAIFENVGVKEFENLINTVIDSKELDALFPFSTPYYYDIFALRKKGWVENNNLSIARNLKDKLKFGSFFINYLLIFRKQFSKNKFKEDLIAVKSAFGGVGIYKIVDIDNLEYLYSPDFSNLDMVSEHISFNSNFNNLYIKKDWAIPAPEGYVFFNSSSLKNKIGYFFRSIKNDFTKLVL